MARPQQPAGIAFGSSGRLYVANNNNSTVTVYRRGQQNPSRTITAGVNSPTFVTVDGADDLFVASPYAPHNITVYHLGQSTPFLTLTNGLSWPNGMIVRKTIK